MQFAAMTTRLRREGDVTNHMAAGLPRRPEDHVPVAAAPVGAISMVPPDAADVEVGATWRGAQRRRTQLEKGSADRVIWEGAQRRRTQLGGLPRATWTPREQRLSRVDRADRRAADDALPTAQASSSVVVGMEVFCGVMRLSRIGERLKLLAGGVGSWTAPPRARLFPCACGGVVRARGWFDFAVGCHVRLFVLLVPLRGFGGAAIIFVKPATAPGRAGDQKQVYIAASFPDRPNYATDEWARTHLSHFDTHGHTRDDIEIGMATILNYRGAHPMSIPIINGLTIVHGTGLHSVTPDNPPSAE